MLHELLYSARTYVQLAKSWCLEILVSNMKITLTF